MPAPKTALDLTDLKSALPDGFKILNVYERESWDTDKRVVAVVLTPDNQIAVLKEIFDERDNPKFRGGVVHDLEQETLEDLASFVRVPKLLGTMTLCGREFLLREFTYGTRIADLSEYPRSTHWELECLQRCISTLACVHRAGVLVRDIHDENLLVDGRMFDFSHACRMPHGSDLSPSWVMNDEYVAPEVKSSGLAGWSSDLFSLMAVFCERILGSAPTRFHPSGFPLVTMNYREEKDHNSFVAHLFMGPLHESHLARECFSPETLACMIHEYLAPFKEKDLVFPTPRKPLPESVPYALLPMRAAVPHKGHIRLIERVIQLGFRPIISLQQSMYLDKDNPIPKWVVAKMIAQALREDGFSDSDLTFVYMPFLTHQEMRLRWLMMPEWDRVRMVVSGNHGMHECIGPILGEIPLIDARAICGDLSDYNGTQVRRMLSRDGSVFVDGIQMVPPSVLRWDRTISSIRTDHGSQRATKGISFVVSATPIQGLDQRMDVKWLPLEGPEEAVMRAIRSAYPQAIMVDKYSHVPCVHLGGDEVYGLKNISSYIDPSSGTAVESYSLTME